MCAIKIDQSSGNINIKKKIENRDILYIKFE